MTGLVETIRAEHARALDLTDRMLDAHERRPARTHRARRSIDDLVALESRHEATEAQVLWPLVRDVLPHLAALRAAALRQERDARRDLFRLHRAAGTAAALDLVPRVALAITAHVGLENSQILGPLESELRRTDDLRLGRLYRELSQRAPTRPHPYMPAIPGVLALTSPWVRKADRIRDLLGSR